ncbi:plasmid mobilization protein [Telluribacter humicola]|uniref:plasmid mobilization protein n=1 Tax=Telluribacter humicola TaxID=1720261 RepID=UPI001A96E2DC|nr:plasmid mobilization relaxosome protein MobC [Telluribacter humicola]
MEDKPHYDPRKTTASKREKKDKVILLRVNQKEYETIKANATLAGLSVSHYLRRLGINHPVKARFEKEEKRNLQGIGNNLNQLTAYAHKGLLYEKQLLDLLDKLKSLLKV